MGSDIIKPVKELIQSEHSKHCEVSSRHKWTKEVKPLTVPYILLDTH